MQAIVSYELESLFDERKDADLLIWIESPVFVLIEDSHEIFYWAYFGKIVEIWLKFFEDDF